MTTPSGAPCLRGEEEEGEGTRRPAGVGRLGANLRWQAEWGSGGGVLEGALSGSVKLIRSELVPRNIQP